MAIRNREFWNFFNWFFFCVCVCVCLVVVWTAKVGWPAGSSYWASLQGLGHASSGECFNFSVDRSVIRSVRQDSLLGSRSVCPFVRLSVSQSMSYISQSELNSDEREVKETRPQQDWMDANNCSGKKAVSDQSYLFPVSLLKWKHKK